jgi:predicted transcriptional regulator
MTKSDRIYIRVDPELKAKLQELADRDHRTLSNYIELVLKREIEKQTKQG